MFDHSETSSPTLQSSTQSPSNSSARKHDSTPVNDSWTVWLSPALLSSTLSCCGLSRAHTDSFVVSGVWSNVPGDVLYKGCIRTWNCWSIMQRDQIYSTVISASVTGPFPSVYLGVPLLSCRSRVWRALLTSWSVLGTFLTSVLCSLCSV